MRDTIFQAILAGIKTVAMLSGSDGTVRVYDYPETAPPGYPYAVVSIGPVEGVILDNSRDLRLYTFLIQVVSEKFGSESGFSQSNALKSMRDAEDAVLAVIDANANFGVSNIVWSEPTANEPALTDGNTRYVMTVTVKVHVTTSIHYS